MFLPVPVPTLTHAETPRSAMTSAQTRIADHISAFYSAADRTSEGAIAAHAYKQSATELESVISRELASLRVSRAILNKSC